MSMAPPGIGCSVSKGPYPSTPISRERSTLTLLSFRYRRLCCSLVLVSAAARLVALSVIFFLDAGGLPLALGLSTAVFGGRPEWVGDRVDLLA